MKNKTEAKKSRRLPSKGENTRDEILKIAVDLASAYGLEGLTIGRLASRLRMSKSGLFAHFGSKQELQLATIEAARDVFIGSVVQPTNDVEAGGPRLRALLEAWVSSTEKSAFSGGCFFAAASAEFDGRPGAVRDRIAKWTKAWVEMLEEEAREAQLRGELNAEIDPAQVVFEMHAFVQEANWAWQLLGDKAAAIRRR